MNITKDKKLRKDFFWNTIGSTFSSFNSLFFLIIVTRINGINDAGVFTFAFSTACLFYVIANYSGRVYQVTEKDNTITDTDYFYSKLITCFLTLVVGLIFCIIRGYDLYKTLIIIFLTLYKILEAFSEFLYAIIQKNDFLYKTGQSLFLKAITSLILFTIINYLTKNLLLSCLMIILGNLIYIIVFDLRNIKNLDIKKEKMNTRNIYEILRKGFYVFGFTFLTLYLINAQKYVIDSLMENKYQTIFGIIIMPATILILFGQFIIQPFLVTMKNLLKENIIGFKKLVLKMSLGILSAGFLALIVAYFIGIPFLEILYNIKLNSYLTSLLIIIIGATFYAITTIISTALTTMRKTKSQFLIFAIDSIFTFFISRYLVMNYSIIGASFAYMITMAVLLILYIILFIYETRKDDTV